MNCLITRAIKLLERIPHSLIAFIARFSIAAVFWKSGQTKVEGLAIDLFDGTFELGWPRLADSTIPLFKSEYHVPLLSPEIAAHMAAFAEHLFPMLGVGAAGHDPDHSVVCVPGCLPDSRHVGGGVAVSNGDRAREIVHRSSDRQALPLKAIQRLTAAFEPADQIVRQHLRAFR
jgi:hypothetical protein